MAFPAIGLFICLIATAILLVVRNMRVGLAALSLIYLGVFFVIFELWPLEQAAIILVGGWMASAVLGATGQLDAPEHRAQDAGAVFRLLIFAVLLLVSWSVSQQASVFIPGISIEGAFAGLLLLVSGMVRSGIVQDPLQVILSLLMVFAGFGLIYSFISNSSLMTALLAGGNLGLSLLGAYLALRYSQSEGTQS
jgi:hypothetical protein